MNELLKKRGRANVVCLILRSYIEPLITIGCCLMTKSRTKKFFCTGQKTLQVPD